MPAVRGRATIRVAGTRSAHRVDAVYPPIVPEVQVVPFSSTDPSAEPDRAIIVVRVHESDETPHSVDGRTAIYLRTDNVSTRFLRKATVGELEWLVNKREKSVAERQRVLGLVERHAAVYRNRRAKQPIDPALAPLLRQGQFAFFTIPRYPRSPLKDPWELTKIAQENAVQIPAVPHTLPAGTPQPVAEGIVFEDQYGTTELQQQGMVYHSIDFWWDKASTPGVTRGPRTVLPRATAAFLWGMLEFAARAYKALAFAGLVDVEFRLAGVRDAFFKSSEDLYASSHPIVDDVIIVRRTNTVADLRDRTLEIATDCQRELYWSCGINAGEELLKQDFARCKPT